MSGPAASGRTRLLAGWLACLLVAPSGCKSSNEQNQASPRFDASPALPDGGPAPPTPPPPAPIALDCDEGSCPPCADQGRGCATDGELIPGTCCGFGDSLTQLASGAGSEVVDIETDGKWVVLCGGFGADISDISDPRAPRQVGSATSRCQRIAFGALLEDGSRVLYLAHHGDSWVEQPFLATYRIGADGAVAEVDIQRDAAVLFEGLRYDESSRLLYVAAHGGGLRVYRTDPASGVPTFERALTDGIKNAWKLDLHGELAYLADLEAGLQVISLADPRAPTRLRTVETTGSPRDLDAAGDRLFVALGGGGVDVFDIGADPTRPKLLQNIRGRGSAQAVAVDDDLLAIASWSHVAVRDARSLALLGVQKVRASFEQDLGVAIHGRQVMVGEWEGLHLLRYEPGRVGPMAFVDEDLFSLAPDVAASRAVVVRNLGPLDLHVSAISVDDPAFTVNAERLTVKSGEAEAFELAFAPPASNPQLKLRLITDDPDPRRARLEVPISVRESQLIGVGDKLTERFAFLDPSGAGQLSALEGKVTVLAYFALF